MSARSRLNGNAPHAVPLPVKPAPLSPQEQDAKAIVMGMVKRVGFVGVERMIEMSLPRFVALTALAEATLPHDDELVNLLGALERGTNRVAEYMHTHTPTKAKDAGVVA